MPSLPLIAGAQNSQSQNHNYKNNWKGGGQGIVFPKMSSGLVGSTLVKLRSGVDPDDSNEVDVTTLPSDKALRTPNMRKSPQ